jgi:hypothetical protein
MDKSFFSTLVKGLNYKMNMALKLLCFDYNGMKDKDKLLKESAHLLEDIEKMLRKAAQRSFGLTEEQFLTEVMIGNCPRCTSKQTKSCEKHEGIEDFTVGLCISCGYLWCSECGKELKNVSHCDHLDICRKCDDLDESGACGIDLKGCKKLRSYRTNGL